MNGDPYLDPHSGVLLNKFGLSDHDALAREEQVRTGLRGILLKSNPVPGNFDLEHLQSIHQYIFQDIYDWAGQVRTISMAKADLGSVTHFTPPELIKRELDQVFNTLAEENFLRALTRAEFARKAARLLSDINQIHPFRDGNGRTQREFLRQIAESGRHPLHFEVVSRARMVQASIRSAQNDLGMMERLFDEITDSARIRPLKDAVEFFEKNGSSWNDRYLATTTPGQTYSGRFAGNKGEHFMFCDEADRILIGNLADIPADLIKMGNQIEFKAS